MNRQERRALQAEVRKLRAAKVPPGPAWSVVCEADGHDFPEAWTMRPALVGAGIVIPKAHFDRYCRRCRQSEIVWVDIEGGHPAPQHETMTLTDWLAATGASVEAPAGEIRVPDQAELAALLRKARS